MKHVAVVTGGARGIGLAIAQRLLEDGNAVALWDLDGDGAENAARELASMGGDVIASTVDVTDPDTIQAALDAIRSGWGRLDVLVNNAGVISHASVFEVTNQEWRSTLEVNLTGAFQCAHAAAPIMKAQHYGRIVNIASMAARTGGESSGTAYAAAKAGVVGLTKSLSRQLGPHGVTVNAIAPGIIDTAMISGMEPATREAWIHAIPLRRLGTTADVAAAVSFFTGEDGSYVSGVTLDVNGGYYVA